MLRGQRSVSDAVYIRDNILPSARIACRWNVVVYEAFRVCELLLKGFVCLAGYTPKSNHELGHLLDQLPDLLSVRSRKLPFLVGIADDQQNAYGVSCDGETVWLQSSCSAPSRRWGAVDRRPWIQLSRCFCRFRSRRIA